MKKITKNNNQFEIRRISGKTDEEVATRFLLSQSAIGASSAKLLSHNGVLPEEALGLDEIKNLLDSLCDEINQGNLRSVEEMLFSQAFALNIAFNSLIARSNRQDDLATKQMFMNLCLKAQNQSRAALEAIVRLRQPNATTFVRQANIANTQQVNNDIQLKKSLDTQNELLGTLNEYMDIGKKDKTKTSNSKLDAMAKVNRSN